MWIQREISSALRHSIETRPALVLTGARQVGKTSLVEHLFPHFNYVTLDLPSEAAQAEEDPQSFLQRHPSPLIIDEVQYAPKLFRHLKVAIDGRRSQMGQYVLTGSQKFQLMSSVSESLAGRFDLFDLESLSHSEIVGQFPNLDLNVCIWQGGFPELYAQPHMSRKRFFQSYVASYLERDVKALANVSDLRDFERFIRACALRNAQILNKAELARDVGVSPTTANAWLSILQASNQIYILEPWFSNKTKSLVKSPKMYFMDTGLLCFLLNIETSESLVNSPFVGAIWETYVCGQIRRQLSLQSRSRELFFWNDRVREVDFLLETGGLVRLLEAKWTEVPDLKAAEGLVHAQKKITQAQSLPHALICRTPNSFPLSPDITAMGIDDLRL